MFLKDDNMTESGSLTLLMVRRLVSDTMGGAIDREKLQYFLWELHISEQKLELQSNVIPIGKIKKGTFYHRALLFKVASSHAIHMSIIRGSTSIVLLLGHLGCGQEHFC